MNFCALFSSQRGEILLRLQDTEAGKKVDFETRFIVNFVFNQQIKSLSEVMGNITFNAGKHRA